MNLHLILVSSVENLRLNIKTFREKERSIKFCLRKNSPLHHADGSIQIQENASDQLIGRPSNNTLFCIRCEENDSSRGGLD